MVTIILIILIILIICFYAQAEGGWSEKIHATVSQDCLWQKQESVRFRR
jgi:hypothetical protein